MAKSHPILFKLIHEWKLDPECILDARYDSYAEEKAGNKQQESRLLTHLMENYDREVRPVYNATKAVVVKVGITLTQIFDMVSIILPYNNYVWMNN